MKWVSIIACCFFLFLIHACNKDEVQIPSCPDCPFSCLDPGDPDVITNNCMDNWDCSFTIIPRSKVDINEHNGYSGGNKRVFQMMNSTEGDLNIADDEITRILVFELSETQTSFSVDDDNLKDMGVFFITQCYCTEVEFKAVDSGCLQGEKQTDGSWFVQANLNVPYSFGDVVVKLDAQFTAE